MLILFLLLFELPCLGVLLTAILSDILRCTAQLRWLQDVVIITKLRLAAVIRDLYGIQRSF